MNEYIENNQGYKILTENGYKSFAGIAYMGDKPIYRIVFNNSWLECTINHRVIDWKGEEIFVSDLKQGDKILSLKGGYSVVKEITDTGKIEAVYDIIDVDGHKFYANNILVHNCEFIIADNTLISSAFLKDGFIAKPEIFKTGHIRWYSEIKPNKQYAITLDPAMGTGHGDYAAIQIFSLPDMEQVGEWRSQIAQPHEQVRILLQILTFIYNSLKNNSEHFGDPEIYWTVENNSLGEAVLTIIDDTGEDNFPGWFIHEPKKSGMGRRRKGLNTNKRSKLLACSKLKHLIETRKMIINSKFLISELKTFVSHSDSFAASQGANDDLVSATLLIVRIIGIITQSDADLYEQLNDAIDLDDTADMEPMPIVF